VLLVLASFFPDLQDTSIIAQSASAAINFFILWQFTNCKIVLFR
jgi:hypothetical protein